VSGRTVLRRHRLSNALGYWQSSWKEKIVSISIHSDQAQSIFFSRHGTIVETDHPNLAIYDHGTVRRGRISPASPSPSSPSPHFFLFLLCSSSQGSTLFIGRDRKFIPCTHPITGEKYGTLSQRTLFKISPHEAYLLPAASKFHTAPPTTDFPGSYSTIKTWRGR
jgi:hypothetical protein